MCIVIADPDMIQYSVAIGLGVSGDKTTEGGTLCGEIEDTQRFARLRLAGIGTVRRRLRQCPTVTSRVLHLAEKGTSVPVG